MQGINSITNNEELEAFAAALFPKFMEYLATHSRNIFDCEVATSMDGIKTMPALYDKDGVRKQVVAPQSLLTQDVTAEANTAKEAADAANAAADKANNAATAASDATSNLADEKEAVEAAIEKADTAAGNADKSRQDIEAAETTRSGNETTRQDNESARQTAEAERQAAETARREAETQRQATYVKSATATTLEPGSQATATISGNVLTIGVPKGEKGDTGLTGATGATGPKGDKGDKGDAGDVGVVCSPKAGFPENGETGRLYAATDENAIYRWDGTAYMRLGISYETISEE